MNICCYYLHLNKKKEKDLNFKIFPDENNLHKWNGVLNGPSGTPYQVSIKLKCCKEE